jgi:hypothetical protein
MVAWRVVLADVFQIEQTSRDEGYDRTAVWSWYGIVQYVLIGWSRIGCWPTGRYIFKVVCGVTPRVEWLRLFLNCIITSYIISIVTCEAFRF